MVRSSLFMAGAVFGEVPSIVECHFLWQAAGAVFWTLVCLHLTVSAFKTSHFTRYTENSALETTHFTLHALHHTTLLTTHFRLLDFTLHTPHLTVYTLHCAPYNPQSTRAIHNLHFTLCTTLHFTLHTPESTLHTSQSTLDTTLYTPHCTLHTSRSTLHTPHCALYTLHCALYIQHSTLHFPHSKLHTPHFALHALHHTLHSTSGNSATHLKNPTYRNWWLNQGQMGEPCPTNS